MQKSIKNIKSMLKISLDKARYEHTIGVAYTAVCLGMKYNCDLKKTEIAGLLHDCAKCIPDSKKLKKCVKHNINITDIERKSPYLLHAKLGAFLAMNQYNIQDKDIINAILNHTTGAPAMTLLEKIIFVSDYIEPRRFKAINLTKIRKIAFEDLDLAVYMILKDTLEYLESTGNEIDKMTVKAYEYYMDMLGKES